MTFLKTFSWQELQHNPWRNLAAAVAVMLGVALAFSVHLINASALSEFSQAVRSVNGQADLELRGVQGTFDEAVFERVASHPQVAVASPVLELASYGVAASGKRTGLRVVGVDALVVARVAPALMPVPGSASNNASNGGADAERFAIFTPGFVFLNATARLECLVVALPVFFKFAKYFFKAFFSYALFCFRAYFYFSILRILINISFLFKVFQKIADTIIVVG